MSALRIMDCQNLPDAPDVNTVYRLPAQDRGGAYYWERIDRNIGWITKEEQEMLRHATVGIAGCGGMGGLLGQIFVRLGVGEVRIADCEEFDISNINRQFGAERETVGQSKALVTAQKIRKTSDDTTLIVYPQGITEETAQSFTDGCDIICDEIEFWAVGARILLHMTAREKGLSIFNCNTVGFSTHLFFFTPDSLPMEECLEFSYAEAKELQRKIQARTAKRTEVHLVMEHVLNGLVPQLPEYCPKDPEVSTVHNVRQRLFEEGKAPIIATNPPLASGFLADHVLLYLLRNSLVQRDVLRPPEMPDYLHFDAARFTVRTINRKEQIDA